MRTSRLRALASSACRWSLVLAIVVAPRFASGAGGGVDSSAPASSAPASRANVDDAVHLATFGGDYAKAEAVLQALSNGPSTRDAATLALADLYLLEGKTDLSFKAAAVASALHKRAAACVQAEALHRAGKLQEAIRLLEPLAKETGKDNALRRARALLGAYRIEAGKRADAEAPLMDIIAEYNASDIAPTDAEGLYWVGRAATMLRSAKDANAAFQESEKANKDFVDRHVAWSALFLDNYDPGHAEELVRDALKLAPKRPDALVLAARIKLEQSLDFGAAESLVKEALAIDPGRPDALAIRAGISLHDMAIADADKAIDLGLKSSPASLELLSLRAAGRFLADDKPGYEKAKAAVFAKNPEYSEFFGIVREYAEWEHRYDDIVSMMREAVKVDPDDSKAWAELGLTLTRNAEEKEGRDALEKAWKKDHFNVRVFNTLNLYDKQIDVTYQMDPESKDSVFRVRYPKDEKAVLERYVPRLLGEAWASMKTRYGFVPKTPVQIELYGDREAFSVRTSGLPNIGIQGVCFGRLVAAMSPKSESFNWGNVLWHELGHVFAIQLSQNHVPRWFTEGLSEYETIARRPEWQRTLDPELYLALKKGTLPAAVDMTRAFTHASNGLDVTVAYYAASQLLVFTAEKYGMPRIVDALKLWGQGKTTPEVIEKAFGTSPAEYDAGFKAWARARLARYEKQFVFDGHAPPLEEARAALAKAPGVAARHVDLALALAQDPEPHEKGAKAGTAEKVRAELDKALSIDAADMRAHYILAKIAGRAKDSVGELAHLLAIKKAGGDGYEIELRLADIAEERRDHASVKAALENASRFDPMQPEPLKGLFDLANGAKDEKGALKYLEKIAPLDQHNRKVWRMLVQRLVAAGRFAEAARAGESAVMVDIEHPGTHVAYGVALEKTGKPAGAVFEYESAALCKGPAKDLATAHERLAALLPVVGRGAEAQRHADQAKELGAAAASEEKESEKARE